MEGSVAKWLARAFVLWQSGAVVKFRHSNPDALPLASLLRALRAALKSDEDCGSLITASMSQAFRKFYDREHAYRKFRKFGYQERVALKLPKFRNLYYREIS